MNFSYQDMLQLQKGQPPENSDFILDVTLGKENWIDNFFGNCLDRYVAHGGSKVKVLVGSEGSGKTHLLKYIQFKAEAQGYETISFSARDNEVKLNDIIGFYKAIATRLDKEKIIRGFCNKVAERLGYGPEKYDGTQKLLPFLIEDGITRYDAEREIRNAVGRVIKEAGFSPSFSAYSFIITRDRMVSGTDEGTKIANKWLNGEKLERYERQISSLFEPLQKSNARYWLNSLIKLLNFSDIKGLIVQIDNIEVLTEKSTESNRFLYTPNAIKDVCELIRQIIDDVELLNRFVLILAGRRSIIDDEKRGFRSYEALWMRLQSGLVPSKKFNAFSDVVDVDKHLEALGTDFPGHLSVHMVKVMQSFGFKRKFMEDLPKVQSMGTLREIVMENAIMSERMEI
ncbi:MAG: DUF2791 family P-loop domain-containing protein [Clostridiales bacterium]|nr:DUF2791 family P-loop domain-containing protein [Clostridiales bacterium]